MSLKFPKNPVLTFQIDGPPRRFIVINPTFGTIKPFLMVDPFNAMTETGEQRYQTEKHVNELREAMRYGKYTPTPLTAGVRPYHVENCLIYDEEKAKIDLLLDEEHPFPVSDGGHRLKALETLWEQEKSLRKKIDSCNITLSVLLEDDKTGEDFINLQLGLKMDPSHMKSLKLKTKSFDDKMQPLMQWSHDVAIRLNADKDSFLYKQVRFDTSGAQAKLPIHFNSLTATGGSDLSTSLTAASKVCSKYNKLEPEWAASIYTKVYQYILENGSKVSVFNGVENVDEPALFQAGKVLCPKILNGTKGGSGLLVGLGNVVIYSSLLENKDEPDQDDYDRMLQIAEKHLNKDVVQTYNTHNKRHLIHLFTKEYFKDMANVPMTDGIPTELCELTAFSTWGAKRPEKEKKPSTKKKKGDQDGNNEEADTYVAEIQIPEPVLSEIAAPDASPGFLPDGGITTPVVAETQQAKPEPVAKNAKKNGKKGAPPVQVDAVDAS